MKIFSIYFYWFRHKKRWFFLLGIFFLSFSLLKFPLFSEQLPLWIFFIMFLVLLYFFWLIQLLLGDFYLLKQYLQEENTLRVPRFSISQSLAKQLQQQKQAMQEAMQENRYRAKQLRQTLQAAPIALVLINAEGSIAHSNQEAFRLFGSSVYLGRFYWEAFRQQSLLKLLEAPTSKKSKIEYQEKILLVSVAKTKGITVLAAQDITAEAMAEQKEKELVANVSHEIRTPLSVILGYAETLALEDSGHVKEYAEIIQKHATHLLELVENLLHLEKIKSQHTQKIQTNLVAEVLQVVDTYQWLAHQKGLAFHFRYEANLPKVMVHPLQIEILIRNLIENAIRYTEQGEVLVELKKEKQAIALLVQDTGPGILPEEREKIFEKFYRIDKSRARSKGGSGLGLALVKEIAAHHKASIQVLPNQPQGSIFKVLFG